MQIEQKKTSQPFIIDFKPKPQVAAVAEETPYKNCSQAVIAKEK